MAVLITPVGMLITVALLALYGAYGLWTAITERSWIAALTAAVAIVACVGAALVKAWSRFPVYVLTAVFIGTWAYSVYDAAAAGYFSLFSVREILLALAPGFLLVVLSSICAFIVYRQFRVVPPPS